MDTLEEVTEGRDLHLPPTDPHLTQAGTLAPPNHRHIENRLLLLVLMPGAVQSLPPLPRGAMSPPPPAEGSLLHTPLTPLTPQHPLEINIWDVRLITPLLLIIEKWGGTPRDLHRVDLFLVVFQDLQLEVTHHLPEIPGRM